MGNKVIGIIIDFVKALQSKDRALISIESNRTYKISSPKYLLGQILRQYELEPKICGITHIDNMFTVKMMNQC